MFGFVEHHRVVGAAHKNRIVEENWSGAGRDFHDHHVMRSLLITRHLDALAHKGAPFVTDHVGKEHDVIVNILHIVKIAVVGGLAMLIVLEILKQTCLAAGVVVHADIQRAAR